MKKTSLISAIIAFTSFVCFAVAMIFIKWDRTEADATSSTLITSIMALAIIAVTFGVFALIFDKKHKMLLLIPVIGLFVATIVFTKGVNEIVARGNATIFDILSPTSNNPTIIALLLAIAFITSIVFIIWKNYKWASIVAITYLVLLIVATYNNISEILFTEKNLLYVLSSCGLLISLASMVVYFIAPFVASNEIVSKPKPEKKVEEPKAETNDGNAEEASNKDENNEANEEAPAEENKEDEKPAEENNEANADENKDEAKAEEKADDNNKDEKADEEKKDDWNPFKNQYSSSSTVFDVQDENENK